MAWKVWISAIEAGATLLIDCAQADDSDTVDFTDVTTAEVHVQLVQGGEAVITDVTLANQTTTTLRLIATFDDPPEITQPGKHTVTCKLARGVDEPVWTKPRVLSVRGKYEVNDG